MMTLLTITITTPRAIQITRFALVGGTNAGNMIRRMLSATMANRVACIFNWAGKGPKRAFKDTLMQDCRTSLRC
ncbi:unnamed protein product [Boreogadus saida]